MKRIEEKVKDIVEVRSHGSIVNFGADPAQTVSGYHFTDVTSDLMSKWLNQASRTTNGNGTANALAGFRGVGKSHFLATLGALLGHADLRSRISDPLVSSTLHALARRQFPVAFIRRGTSQTLLEELKEAIGPILGIEADKLNDSLTELLMQAAHHSGDLPLVLLIDTAFERSERVSRDDGAVLAEIADIAKRLGVFVGIALDDDIAGADGVNSGISKTFAIDYLDQEHLYKIVDSHIFPKHQRMRPVLHHIHNYYRDVVPGFRWSEQRFSSLYPLHPAIMEIAPFVRLYLHEFALLGFASEAGARIMGRPANSLIAPDEVFDNVEKGLRQVDVLKDAFITFDKLNDAVVAKTPVMKRLQAKLILKGLFLFSLNDEGTTAAEIGASMLIFDENSPLTAVQEVQAMLNAFADAMPSHIQITTDNSGESRFSFRLFDKDDLKIALEEAAVNVSEQEIEEALKKLMCDRFADCSFSPAGGDAGVEVTESTVVWRGGRRKGRVYWDPSGDSGTAQLAMPVGYDWKATISFSSAEDASTAVGAEPKIIWKPAELREDEKETIRRLAVLQSDPTVRSEFKDHITAAIQTHSVAAEKIFQRAFLADGVLSIDGFEYNFTDEARDAQSLMQVTTAMLESFFEGRFPSHPYFSQVIRMKEVSSLVSDFFSGARPTLDEVQWLAATYALPLGLVEKQDDNYAPVSAEQLAELPLVEKVLVSLDDDRDSASLESVFLKLGEAPQGLVREASYLLMAAMAGARMIEFVTASGDRINRRSMDLKIIWDDVVAVARPAVATYPNARLIWWASKVAGHKQIRSLDQSEDRLAIISELQDWVAQWEKKNISKLFDEISDDSFNSRIWRLATISLRSFVVVADSINTVLLNGMSLESCLERIADVFSDSESEYDRRKDDLVTVEEFISGASVRNEAAAYLSLCEFTGDPNVDQLRLTLQLAIEANFFDSKTTNSDNLNILWQKFRRAYAEYYTDRHDLSPAARDEREKLSEIMATDIWREFESVSVVPGFDPKYKVKVRRIVGELQRRDCDYKVSEILENQPYCGCSFSLFDADPSKSLSNQLWATINDGVKDFRKILGTRKDVILATIASGLDKNDPEIAEGAKRLRTALQSNEKIGRLTAGELRLITIALSGAELSSEMIEPPPAKVNADSTDASFEASVEEIESMLESVV